jgi:hypothetical protein
MGTPTNGGFVKCVSSDVIDPCQLATDRIDYRCTKEVHMVGNLVRLRENPDGCPEGWRLGRCSPNGLVVRTYSVDELNKMIETNRYETELVLQQLVGKNKVDKPMHEVYWAEGYSNPWWDDELIFLTGGN